MAGIQSAQDMEGPGSLAEGTFGVDGIEGGEADKVKGMGPELQSGTGEDSYIGFDITMIKYLRKQLKGGLGLWLQSMQSIMVRRVWNSRVIHIMVN